MRFDITKLFNLQLFADGGEGGSTGAAAPAGDGAVTASMGVETASAADSQRLRDLGVPENLVKRHEARNKKRGRAMPASAQQTATESVEVVPAAEEPTAPVAEEPTVQPSEAPKRLSWDEIMADPEYNKEMQKTISNRLKSSKAAESALGKIKPALEVLAGYYKMDASDLDKLDVDALVKAVTEDRTYYEDRSIAEGRSVDEVMREAAQARKANDLREENLRKHFTGLREQEAVLRQTIPNFDLNLELQNPVFARMTAPGSMLTLEQAYNAVHHKEIVAAAQERAHKEAVEAVSKSVQAGRTRPQEAGQNATAAPVPSINMQDKNYREQLKRQIRAAAANGQHLPLQGGRR